MKFFRFLRYFLCITFSFLVLSSPVFAGANVAVKGEGDEVPSYVLNQAIRDKEGTVESEFKVTNSKDNKKLLDCITNLEPRFKIYSVK